MSKKSLIIKSIIFSSVALILGGLYATDYVVSKQYDFELVAKSDDVIIADGVSSVRFRVKLSKDGEPVANHKIYFYASNGSLPTNRLITNENGLITFTYYPYLFVNEKVTPLDDVNFYFQNESNSFFFMVPATWSFTMPVEKPDEYDNVVDWEHLELDL